MLPFAVPASGRQRSQSWDTIAGWSIKAREAFSDQWVGAHATGWEWPEIFRRYNDPDRLETCLSGERMANDFADSALG
jgi:hypothetical protein